MSSDGRESEEANLRGRATQQLEERAFVSGFDRQPRRLNLGRRDGRAVMRRCEPSVCPSWVG